MQTKRGGTSIAVGKGCPPGWLSCYTAVQAADDGGVNQCTNEGSLSYSRRLLLLHIPSYTRTPQLNGIMACCAYIPTIQQDKASHIHNPYNNQELPTPIENWVKLNCPGGCLLHRSTNCGLYNYSCCSLNACMHSATT